MTRFGSEVEYDLAVIGWELGELWRERRWRFLLNLIARLPRTSQTREAMVASEEFIEQVMPDDDKDSKDKGPRFSEFSAEVEALFVVADRLGDVCSGLVGLGGKKPKRVNPLPRPQTAYDRVKVRRRREQHNALVARVIRRDDA